MVDKILSIAVFFKKSTSFGGDAFLSKFFLCMSHAFPLKGNPNKCSKRY